MIDRGASLSWLSQYPHEREILFAPLTGLEVRDARVEERVLVLEMKLNVNLTSLTIEEVVAKRRGFLSSLAESFERELDHELQSGGAGDVLGPGLQALGDLGAVGGGRLEGRPVQAAEHGLGDLGRVARQRRRGGHLDPAGGVAADRVDEPVDDLSGHRARVLLLLEHRDAERQRLHEVRELVVVDEGGLPADGERDPLVAAVLALLLATAVLAELLELRDHAAVGDQADRQGRGQAHPRDRCAERVVAARRPE